MNIHIVAPRQIDEKESQILARLAGILAEGTGWTLSDKPDIKADINYFFPYLLYDGFDKTMTAAWFTHKEEGEPKKVSRWNRAAQEIDLRTVSTEKYREGLDRIGRTTLVTPPIDPQFQPGGKRGDDKLVVGISGYVYDTGRKGEWMVKNLARSQFSDNVILKAAGGGWPVPTENYAWKDMPDFYRSLDVLLCTSRIEGPGYPPLEALACGIKVVVPRDVGIFDELPDLLGIHRYESNDYSDMLRVLQEAIGTEADPQALRGVVGGYTAEQWVEDHRQAFSQLLWPTPPIPDGLPDWRGNCGVYVVAYGEPACKCAATAITSWHEHMPGVPVCLASDEPLGIEDVFVQEPDADVGARSIKTRIYDLAPQEWQYVVYVDADTEVIADVGFLFDVLADGWELAICYNPVQYILARNMIRRDNANECEETFNLMGADELLQMNGGVFSFRRCDRTAQFFRAWHEEWLKYGKRDQAAFDRALFTHPLRMYILGNEWNCITRYMPAEKSAGIIHRPTLARRWQGIIEGRLDSPEAWKAAGLK